jgi:hypothetical protein
VLLDLFLHAMHSGPINRLWSIEKSLGFGVRQILEKSLNLLEAQFSLLSRMGDSLTFEEWICY